MNWNTMRIRLVMPLAASVALGPASRLCPVGWLVWDRVLGEGLYGVAAYMVWAVILYRRPVWLPAVAAFGCCTAVEVVKLTGIPAGHQHVFLVRWFLGMTFDPVNLAYYLAGVVVATVADDSSRGPTGKGTNVPDRVVMPDIRVDPRSRWLT